MENFRKKFVQFTILSATRKHQNSLPKWIENELVKQMFVCRQIFVLKLIQFDGSSGKIMLVRTGRVGQTKMRTTRLEALNFTRETAVKTSADEILGYQCRLFFHLLASIIESSSIRTQT